MQVVGWSKYAKIGKVLDTDKPKKLVDKTANNEGETVDGVEFLLVNEKKVGIEFTNSVTDRMKNLMEILEVQHRKAAVDGGPGSVNRIPIDSDDTMRRVEGKGTVKGILSSEDAEEIAFNAIQGPNNAESVVLGKFGDGGATAYTKVAESMDAQYFQLDNWDELSSKYSDDEIWKVNEKFLDIETSSGREIYLSHNPEDYIGDGSFYSKEIQYLLDNHYKFVDEVGIWYAIRK